MNSVEWTAVFRNRSRGLADRTRHQTRGVVEPRGQTGKRSACVVHFHVCSRSKNVQLSVTFENESVDSSKRDKAVLDGAATDECSNPVTFQQVRFPCDFDNSCCCSLVKTVEQEQEIKLSSDDSQNDNRDQSSRQSKTADQDETGQKTSPQCKVCRDIFFWFVCFDNRVHGCAGQ